MTREINASTALTKRVKKHFNFLFGIQSQYNEQLILDELPPGLRNEVGRHGYLLCRFMLRFAVLPADHPAYSPGNH